MKILIRLAVIYAVSALGVLGLVNMTQDRANEVQERREAVPVVMSCADTYNPAYCD